MNKIFYYDYKMRIISIASGSSGNCTFIECSGVRLLIDCGIPASNVSGHLAVEGIPPESINCVLLTHEHEDHIGGIFAFSKRYCIPIYMNLPTYSAIGTNPGKSECKFFSTGTRFSIDGTEILPFPVPHDGRDPVGFRIFSDEGDIVCMTDVGRFSTRIAENLMDSRVLLIEANHDLGMLVQGPYPKFLKERIASSRGHLSNDETAQYLSILDGKRPEVIFLSHLSRVNNLPKLASSCAQQALGKDSSKTRLIVADQYIPRGITLS